MHDLLSLSAVQHAARTALVSGGQRWRYDQLGEAVEGAASEISRFAGPGSRVVVLAPNCGKTAIALLGAMRAAAIAVPVHPETPWQRLRLVLEDCRPALIIHDGVPPHQFDAWPGPCASLESIVHDRPVGVAPPPPSPNDIAALFYTSGSTRTPRGVISRHRQMAFCTEAINSVIGNRPDDVILSDRPLSFDYGFYQVMLAIASGATLVLAQNLAAATTLPLIVEQAHITALPVVPSVVGSLLHSGVLRGNRLRGLRYICSTGDTLPTAHIAALQAALPQTAIMPMYGLTECKRVSIMPAERLAGRERSVGLPLPGTGVRIGGLEGPAAPGEIGELYVEGPHVMDGYWQDAVATADRYVVDPLSGKRELRTGDLFALDSEGYLYFVSRADTMIKSYGERIGAAEVEAVLNDFPGVVEAAVVGLPGGVAGESVVAFVATDTAIERPALRRHCATHLTMAARPVRMVISRDLLPRTPNGKIDRRFLRETAARMGHSST